MSLIENRPYCRVPWSSVAVLPNGNVMPCVATNPKSDGVLGNLKQQRFTDIWNSEVAQETRKFHLNIDKGQYLPCSLCFKIKSQKKVNRRDEYELKYGEELEQLNIDYEEKIDPSQILLLDIAFSSLCNLTCTMCSSKYSTSWIDLEYKLKESGFSRSETATPNTGFKNYKDNLNSIFPYLSELKHLLLKGGEPLLSKDCLWFLEQLVERGIAQQVSLKIISNGTVFNQKISDLFRKFYRVDMVVSLDAKDELFRYIRGGSKFGFEEVVENIKRFRDLGPNVHMVTSPTLQAYNAFQFGELIQFCFENSDEVFFKNWVIEPDYQSVISIPRELYPLALENLSDAKSFLQAKQPKNKSIEFLTYMEDYLSERINWMGAHDNYEWTHQKFLSYTKLMNQQRGMELTKIVPEFSPFF